MGFCRQKQFLLEQFTDAVREISRLQEDQTRAIIDDDPDFERFDLLLHVAIQSKNAAKYALLAHVEAHKC